MLADLTLSSSSIENLSPMLRKQAEAYVASRAEKGVDNDSFDVAGAREALQKSSIGRFREDAYDRADIGGVPIYERTSGRLKLLYLHGGGFVGGTVQSHGHIALYLAEQVGFDVVFPEYRLAPEHRFPAAFEDVDTVLSGMDGPLVVAGDSVGGALAVHLALRHPKRKSIRAIAIMAPMLAFTEDTSEYMRTHGRASKMIANSVSPQDAEDPRLSPITADLAKLPPTLVQVGGADYVKTDGIKLASKAIEDGAAVTLEHWPHMPHVWQRFAPDAPEAAQSLNRAAQFLAVHAPETKTYTQETISEED